MKIGNFLKHAVVNGGPAAIALALGSPEFAGVLAAASAAGGGTKIAGKAVEGRTGWRLHKVASPAAAVVAGAAAAPLIDPSLPIQICAVAAGICEQPELLATVPGIAMVIWQVLASGVFKVAPAGDAD